MKFASVYIIQGIMKKLLYHACFYPCEEQDDYTVVVPDLPGCVTQGSSLELVMGNLKNTATIQECRIVAV